MASIPSGTVTFLFTDVAGSTRLWETDRAGMERSLAVHDRMLREAIASNDGVIFATGGDSFSAAFRTASQAVEAAVSAQLTLEGHEWAGPRIRVRMGIHTGIADERDDNYFGPEVTRTARLMAVGHGGQTLVSETAAGLVRDVLPDPVTLADLGSHSLKDMDRSEQIFEIRHPGIPPVTQPLATSSSFGGAHLPDQLTSFVGRSAELSAICHLITTSRMVTLTGVGGTGKTRLAIEATRTSAHDFPDGAWMAELASVTDPERVLTQIADVWGLRPGEGASLIQVVTTFLANRRLLLVVDNCEHVLDTVARLASTLLSTSPGLTVVATSRESLGVAGETVFRVPSMALSEDDGEASRSDAVSLFLERFRAARPGYVPTPEDLTAIVTVCRRLDGIPLGIELAAARLRSMSPVELAERLGESFRILTGSSKTALPRQRTLQATIDWSYDLLEPAERGLFRRASCFVGGFDFDAVTAVCGGALDSWGVLDILDQLVDKSLVSAAPTSRGTRYRMLEPIRQYAQEELADEGESEEAHTAHARYYAGLVGRLAPALRNAEQKAAHQALRVELDNIRAALAELHDAGLIREYLELCFHLGLFWSQASMQVEGVDALLSVLQMDPDVEPVLIAKGWWVACFLAFNLTDPQSVEYGLKGLEAAEKSGDEVAVGWLCLLTAAAIEGTTRRTDAEDFYERGFPLIEANADRSWFSPEWDRVFIGWTRLFLGLAPREQMFAELEETLTAARELGDMFAAAGAMTGSYFYRDGDDDPLALGYLEEAVRILDDLGYRHALGHSLLYWGWVTRDRSGDGVGASALSRGAEMLAEIGDLPCALNHTSDLVDYFADSGQVGDAASHLAFAVRQARSDPARFAPLVAGAACRAAVAAGDFTTAALIVGYLDQNRSPRTSDCREALDSATPRADLTEALAKGRRLSDVEVLDLTGTWTATRKRDEPTGSGSERQPTS